VLPSKHSSTHAVEEAYAHVQGESLKAYAALLVRLLNSPITRTEEDMRFRLVWLGAAVLLAGCATDVVLQATGGSRADGVVNLSYEYGAFQAPKIDSVQALATAKASCAAWDYSGAQAFGGQTTKCSLTTLYGDCARYVATVAYQCTGQTK
jgi:hypothetical protein